MRLDMEFVAENTLADHLRKFYAYVKTANDAQLNDRHSCRVDRHRKLTAPPYNRSMNIMKRTTFIRAKQMFIASCKLNVKGGNPKPEHKEAISNSEVCR